MGADSYRQGGRQKRQKTLASVAQVPKHRSSKDTKRWCRGVPGREHQWRWQEYLPSYPHRANIVWSESRCKNCRKRAQICGFGWASGKLGPAF